jgi:hypothetical protein
MVCGLSPLPCVTATPPLLLSALYTTPIRARFAMDTAYDHIAEENFPKEPEPKPERVDAAGDAASEAVAGEAPPGSLNEEFQEAYKALSSSPWGMKIGGLWGTVKKAVSVSLWVLYGTKQQRRQGVNNGLC